MVGMRSWRFEGQPSSVTSGKSMDHKIIHAKQKFEFSFIRLMRRLRETKDWNVNNYSNEASGKAHIITASHLLEAAVWGEGAVDGQVLTWKMTAVQSSHWNFSELLSSVT